MRGENPPRAHGGWSRAQVWCPFCSRCSPAIGRPGYRGGGLSAPPPLLAAAPSPLSAREWMVERTSAQRCSNSDRLTDWLTLLCPVKPGLWLGEATSTCWLTVANTDTYSWSSEWGTGAGNTGIWVERTCSDPCFGMRNAVPLTFHLSRCHIADFSPPESGAAGQTFTVHHLSPVRLLRHGSSHPVTDIIDQGLFCLSLSESLISYRAKLVSNESTSNC